jgi:hypothetical protein
MYQGNWGRAVLSRVMAVTLLCVLVAALAGVVGRFEVEEIDRMSDQELRQYAREGASTNFVERYVTILIGAAVFVALVEALAGGLRAIVPRDEEPTPSRPHRRCTQAVQEQRQMNVSEDKSGRGLAYPPDERPKALAVFSRAVP